MVRGGRNPRASEASTAALGRPWFVAAVLVLIANDHWLKAAFPGTITGKVSDFAGPAVVATLLAVIFGRTAGVLLTAIGFVALKTVPGVAEAVEPLLGGVTRRDPTDLMGLAVLPLVWRALGRTDDVVCATSDTSQVSRERGVVTSVGRRAPDGARQRPTGAVDGTTAGWIRTRVFPVGGAALSMLALTATSQPATIEVTSLAVSGPSVVAELADPDQADEPSEWAISTDGGLTWDAPDGDVPGDLTPATEEACRSDGHCFAARGGTIEEKAPDGEWTTAFRLSGGKRDLLDYRRSSGGADPDEMFESVIVVPGGETVVVSARDQGVVVLDELGRWQRVSVLDAEATSTNGSMVPLDAATVLLFLSLPVALIVAAARAVKRGGGAWAVIGSTVGALLVAVAVWAVGLAAWALGTFTVQNPIVLAIVLGVLACAVVLLPLAFVRRAIPNDAPA